MITEDYVSLETAKLLKEKGFDIPCNTYFVEVEKETAKSKFKRKFYHSSVAANRNAYKSEMANHYYFSCPTLQMTMKWLREKHNQNITVKAHNNVARLKTIYYAEVQNLSEPCQKGFCVNGCIFKDTYEEACEAAIKYCLENLIKT